MIHIVLYHPEIPQNTGNILRTAAATNATVHLIEPLGFSLSSKHIKRSAANHLDHVTYQVHADWEAFATNRTGHLVFFTRYGQTPHDAFDYTVPGDIYLVFGAESTGMDHAILRDHLDHCFRLPMTDKVRSLNLANTVAVVVYEALRQQGYPGLSLHEPDTMKGKDHLKQ